MSEARPAYRCAEIARAWLVLANLILLVCTWILISGVRSDLLFGFTIFLALAVAATYSVGLVVTFREIEVRLGNGMIRGRRNLAELRTVRWTEGEATWGLGWSHQGRRVFGLGAPHCVWLEFEDGAAWGIGLHRASEAAAAVQTRWREWQLEERDEEGDS